MPLDVSLMMRKNYFIDKCMETEEGREYLAKVKRLNTTEPDYQGLKEFKQIDK